MTTLNYTSTAADPALDETFERALAKAREGRPARRGRAAGELDQLAHGVGGRAQVAVVGGHRRDPQEVADPLEVRVEVAVDRLVRTHVTPASTMSSVLLVASSRAVTPSGIVTFVLP
jgi:hypothetical protein